jgi:hypothetical protein
VAVHQTPPIYKLPVELLQHITTFLSPREISAFSVTDRHICYTIGREHLHRYIRTGSTKLERREKIEVLEQAFPSHWYCAWCDKFHAVDKNGGPKSFGRETRRDCAEFNGYLHGGRGYVLCYHHVRLVMNAYFWGQEHGVGLRDLDYRSEATMKIGRREMPTMLKIDAKIVNGVLLLHSTYTVLVPRADVQNRNFVARLSKLVPQVVAGHRNDEIGHAGLNGQIERALAGRGFRTTCSCTSCATDYLVAAEYHVSSLTRHRDTGSISTIALRIESWRDLSNGRSPFEAAWRAHGEIADSKSGFGGDVMRLITRFSPGQIRTEFEKGESVRRSRYNRDSMLPIARRQTKRKREELRTFLEHDWTREIIGRA